MPKLLHLICLAAICAALVSRRPARRYAVSLRAKAGARGRERAKQRLKDALEKRGAPPEAPAAEKAPPPKKTEPEPDLSMSRAEANRLLGRPALEPMLSRAPPDPIWYEEDESDMHQPMEELVEVIEMPARWAKVEDCERPSRWREAMDDEDCDFQKIQKRLEKEAELKGEKIKDRNPYQELIPQLKTLEDFLSATAKAQTREKAVVVKFYSRQCRACLRIAAKYRRLALELRDEIDCYEVESMASRPLVDGLNVTKVPSVQIYDPDGVTRLANSPCMPDDFPNVQRKVNTAIASMKGKRSIHKVVARSYADELCGKRRELLVAEAPAQPNQEVEACGICPPDETLVYADAGGFDGV